MLDNKRIRQLLRLLERRQPMSTGVLFTIVIVLMLLNWACASVVLREFQLQAAARGFHLTSRTGASVSAFVLVVLMLPGPLAAMAARDWWFRRLVRRRVLATDCVFCSYPLASLRPAATGVCCPECGTNHRTVGEVMLPSVILDAPVQSLKVWRAARCGAAAVQSC